MGQRTHLMGRSTPGSALVQSDIIILTIRRKATDGGDTYGADVHLLSSDVDFTLFSTV